MWFSTVLYGHHSKNSTQCTLDMREWKIARELRGTRTPDSGRARGVSAGAFLRSQADKILRRSTVPCSITISCSTTNVYYHSYSHDVFRTFTIRLCLDHEYRDIPLRGASKPSYAGLILLYWRPVLESHCCTLPSMGYLTSTQEYPDMEQPAFLPSSFFLFFFTFNLKKKTFRGLPVSLVSIAQLKLCKQTKRN